MTINDEGSFDPDTKAIILDAMMADAKTRFGDDLNDSELAVIRLYYDPIAERLAEAQIDLAAILDASQIENASGAALERVVEQVGITRKPAIRATGQARFSREEAASVDYTIPEGTVIQTDSYDPIEFETTVRATLPAGETTVDVNIRAVGGGSRPNLGANTITRMKTPVTGLHEVTNPVETTGGKNEETDPELRERAKTELGVGSRASAPALVRGLQRVEGVKSVSIFINDDAEPDLDGRDPNSFELVVEGGEPQDIADQIMELKAAGDGTVGGVAGTLRTGDGSLPNGQTHPVAWSEPTEVQVYVDMTITTTEDYEGDTAVRDSIVKYIGGMRSSGTLTPGKLKGGDDVLYGEVEFSIRQIPGVYDVTDLKVGLSANPTESSNVEISGQEVATANATDDSLTITRNPL
ncbi:baseplate J/gp47 family protein [Haloterrigena sp. SYSU A558-1]|uniref:Baseplate J/gp47 family protein n=1 Tax=Haloterrigena gelatinilytica TaxID=2741724 RepID=A0ABX2L8E8_9EURY|nr:baseplate J/gp47 family protein [Haloterrigena gelatinilytica]NUC72535.1 baseplate J/gp47 family protein [Haloterrigena gelatinilytica]